MKLDWITDPHLDHLKDTSQLIKFANTLNNRDSDGLIITGDIGESHNVCDLLGIMSGAYQRPIYFVLGNHDYYGDWMAVTRAKVQDTCASVPNGILNWMPLAGPIALTQDTSIVGHGGFYDGRSGLGPRTNTMMTDFGERGIFDLAEAAAYGRDSLFGALFQLGQSSADFLEQQIYAAIETQARRILILTHVPPFKEASYFRGFPSKPQFAPFYVNQSMGEMLLRVAAEYPNIMFEVYAGHTHGDHHYEATKNLTVSVGSAWYTRQPTFQIPIEI